MISKNLFITSAQLFLMEKIYTGIKKIYIKLNLIHFSLHLESYIFYFFMLFELNSGGKC